MLTTTTAFISCYFNEFTKTVLANEFLNGECVINAHVKENEQFLTAVTNITQRCSPVGIHVFMRCFLLYIALLAFP